MPIFYLDASAIVKRYRQEELGSDFMIQLIENASSLDEFYTSFISVLEVTAAITRRIEAKDRLNEILSRFNRDAQEILRLWPLNQELILKAIPVVEQHKLRTGDAIHLATALDISSIEGDTPDMVMVSSDNELIEASTNSNMAHLDPFNADAIHQLNRMRSLSDISDS